MTTPMQAALRLDAVDRTYVQGENRLTVLDRADFAMQPGEMVALVAPSGSGKSTLLHIAGLLERPDGGEVYVDGQPCGTFDDAARTRLRRTSIGFVYQFHHLLPEFSARLFASACDRPRIICGSATFSSAENSGSRWWNW